MKKSTLANYKPALADYLLATFIAILFYLFSVETKGEPLYENTTLLIICVVLAVSYWLLSLFLSWIILKTEVLDDSADKEEVDKEIALFVVLGVFFYLINNSQSLIEANNSLKNIDLGNLNNFLSMSLLISIELLVYSSMSYFFGFKNEDIDEIEDEKGEIGYAPYEGGIYKNIDYTCDSILLGADQDQDQEKNKPKLIAPVLLLLNATKIILVFVAIVFIPIIFELKGADYIKNLAASAGGSVAVLAFIFREGAKSFAAGVRIHMDGLLSIGDNISSKKLEIDGEVKDISVTNIKVRNLDHTITNVPTEKLLSSPFYNLSTRKDHGRRIDLTIYLYIPTIQQLKEDHMVRDKSKMPFLEKYFECKNKGKGADSERVFTNIGSYKAYLKAYLFKHGLIQRESNIIVRSLNETDTRGYIPIQILAYTVKSIQDVKTFRTIESDVMDHALSKLNDFGLQAARVGN